VPYASEAAFVTKFVGALKRETSALQVTCCALEFENGSSSRPDIVAVNEIDEVIAIEAKLSRWRDALNQAYRNAFFADRSYVLLPQAVAERALLEIDEFNLRGVGICTLVEGMVAVVAEAPLLEPHNIYRRELAREHARKRRRRRP
jgi:hypothetical protein